MGKKIAIIGGGNLGTAMAEGLVKSKFSKASEVIVTKRNLATLKSIKEQGIAITDDNVAAVKKSDVIILAVKPFQVTEVLNGIKKELTGNKLLISVVTGVTMNEI
ncbi:MAG: NAD(P)-binding domain-containing protein, partial [Bacteroidota bacterium]